MSDRRQQQERRAPGRVGGRRADDPQPEWLSISDFARRYGVTRPTVYKWIRANVLDVYRMTGIVRVRNLPPDEHSSVSARQP